MKLFSSFVLLSVAIFSTSIVSAAKSKEVYDENIKNHRLNEDYPEVVRPAPSSPSAVTTAKRQSLPLQFKPSPVDDSPFQPEAASTNLHQQPRSQSQSVPASAATRPVFARSLGETGEPVPMQDDGSLSSSLEELDTAAQTVGRVLPGLGWNSGYYNGGYGGNYGGGFGSGNLPCTSCNTIQQPAYNLNPCCTHGFSTCCYVGVQPLPVNQYRPHYPITTITPSLYNKGYKGGHHSYPPPRPIKPWSWPANGYGVTPRPPPYNQYGGSILGGGGLFGGGFGSSLKGGLGFGGKHGYGGEKPGTCYRPSFGSGGSYGTGVGLSGYNNYGYNNYNPYARTAGQNNAGYYLTRSDSSDNIETRAKRDAPVQSYGYNNYNSYGTPGFGSGYGSGGGHGGIIYPTTQKPYYCVRDYECPGNQKCCSGYCSTPSFVG